MTKEKGPNKREFQVENAIWMLNDKTAGLKT